MTDGAPIPFTPPHYSLNRVRVVDLPGFPIDEEVAGKIALELVPVKALVRYALERADELRLPAHLRDDGVALRWELPRLLDALPGEADGVQHRAAEAVITRIGRNLGHVLLALHRGDEINRDARKDWGAAEWDRWGEIRTVWLAGGLASGRIGAAIVRHAVAWLDAAGYGAAMEVEASPFAGETALFGAARYLPPDAGWALCCDYGQTSVKRSLLAVQGNVVIGRVSLPLAFARHEWGVVNDPVREGELYKAFVVDSLCEALALVEEHLGASHPSVGEIMLCVASYVDGGRLIGPGAYATMSSLAPDVRLLLADAIAERTGRSCRIRLIHDGTAAAAVFAGAPNQAVISLGTALGVGFPPATDEGLLTLALETGDTEATKDTTDAHR